MSIKNVTPFLFFFLSFFLVDARPLRRGDDCVYTVLIKTEDLFTRGKTVMKLQNVDGETTEIKDLKPWAGHMGLDILEGRGKCLDGPVSSMNLNSNTWGLNSVELDVTSSRVHIHSMNSELFAVEQWGDRDSTSFHKQLHGGLNHSSCLIFMANAADNMSSLRAISGRQAIFALWNQRSLFHCSSSWMNKMKLEKPFVEKARDEERLLMTELLGSVQVLVSFD